VVGWEGVGVEEAFDGNGTVVETTVGVPAGVGSEVAGWDSPASGEQPIRPARSTRAIKIKPAIRDILIFMLNSIRK
jgi:hypothetical protein